MALETHGRWPLIGAAALAPATAAAVRTPAARPIAALLWHQTEEWVWPGGFMPWMNRELLGSDSDEYPIDRRTGFVVNVVFGWGLSAAAAAGPQAAAPAAALYTSHLGNGAMHVAWALRHRRYDPGAVTGLATLIPVAITGLTQLVRDRRTSRRALAAGVAAGVAISAVFPLAMRRRVRGR
jgi:hypothetical protein